MGQIAAEQILDALDGKPPPRILNPQVWPDYAKRFEQTFGFKPASPPESRTGTRSKNTPCATASRRALSTAVPGML